MQNIKTMKENLVSDLRASLNRPGFENVVFGLSGGIDSALVLALASEAIGAEHVHTFMLKTKYTSQLSIDLAHQVAHNFSVHHQVIDIQPMFDATLAIIAFTPKIETVEQNIQSRIRGLLLMTFSNEFNWKVLACGNKSELAIGYCTLYGDTVGALMPIGDLYKTDVYKMAELFPQIPSEIINRPASAELATNQKDIDSLPPYDVLDAALRRIENGTDLDSDAAIKKQCSDMDFKHTQIPPILKVRI